MTEFSYADALEHFGVKGMKWGVRRDGVSGVSSRTNREAKNDAHEFARAKMFYGEGAGTRRKLIKASVEAKAKKDPSYKKAFDEHLSRQDMSTHASKARSERKRKNASNSTRKTVRGFRHVLNGNSQFASATAALLAGGYLAARKSGIDQTIIRESKKKYRQARQSQRAKQMTDDLLRSMNLKVR